MGSKFLLALVVAWLSYELASAATDKVICYHGSWSKGRSGNGNFGVNDINPNLCTHLIYSFIGINTDGTVLILNPPLEVGSGNLKNFNALKQQNPKLKTLIAIGGWSQGSYNFSVVAASPTLRKTFVQSALNFVQTYGFDGFDLDWEYPAQRGGAVADVANFATLIKEFRTVFDQHGLLLTAAVAAAAGSVDLSYDVPALSKYLDVINVMAYDLHTSWDGATGHNAPLYASSVDTTATAKLLNVDAAIRGWISRGADPQKIALGLGIYGRTYTLSSPSNTGVGAPIIGAGDQGPYTWEGGMLGYNEICEQQLAGGWTTVWDDQQKVPYAYKGNQWVGYDDAKSITIKVNYAKSLNLAGVMIWSIETEDFRGICGPKYPLLNAINSALGTAAEPNGDSTNSGGNEPPVNDNSGGGTNNNNPPAGNETPGNDNTSAGGNGGTNSGGASTSDLCTKVGYVRDPRNCNVYHYCMQVGNTFVPLTQQCSAGLYFDETIQTCNWPQLVSGC